MTARMDRVAVVVLLLWLVLFGLVLASLVFLARTAPTDVRPVPVPAGVPGPPPVVAR